jgi:hypothetical protein
MSSKDNIPFRSLPPPSVTVLNDGATCPRVAWPPALELIPVRVLFYSVPDTQSKFFLEILHTNELIIGSEELSGNNPLNQPNASTSINARVRDSACETKY